VFVGAKVDAMSVATGKQREVLTNEQDNYVIPALPAGTYTFTFSRDGFDTARFEGVELRVGQTLTLDPQLKVGNPTVQVDVKGTAPLLESNSAELAGVVEEAAIDNLPVNGRNWANLLTLAPGAIDDGGGNQRTIRFAGARGAFIRKGSWDLTLRLTSLNTPFIRTRQP
jgi:hypothetical protein